MSSQRSEINIVVAGLEQLREYEQGQRSLNTAIRAGTKAAQEYAAAQQSGVASLRATETATEGLTRQIGAVSVSMRELKTEQAAIAKGYLEIGRQSDAALRKQEAQQSASSRGVRPASQVGTSAIGALGTGLANGAAGITAIGVEAARFAAQFDASLTKVRNNTTMTDAQFAQMKKTVLSLGADTGASFDKLAEGMMHVANFGFQGADAMKILAEANKAATATGGDTATTAQLLAKVLKENGLAAGDAAVTMSKLWYAAANSDAKMAQFVETGGRVFAMAAKMGVSFDQTAAAMSTFLGQGLKASDATTQLIGVLNKIVSPTQAVEKRLEALSKKTGVDLVSDFSLAGLHTKQLSGIFDDLRTVADKVGIPVERLAVSLFPNLRGTIGALIGTSGSGIQGLHDRLNDLANPMKLQADLQARFTDQQKTAQAQWEKLSNTIKRDFLPVGEHFLRLMQDAIPVVKGVANGVLNVMEAFERLPKPVQEAVLAFGALRIASMALGNPLMGLRGGIAAIVAGLQGIPAAVATARTAMAGMAGAPGVSAAVARGSIGAGGLGARVAVGGTALMGRVGPLAAVALGLMGNDAAQWSMEASSAEEHAADAPNLTPFLAHVDRIQAQLRAHPNDPKLKADLAAAWATTRRMAGVTPTMPVAPPPGVGNGGTAAGNAWFDQLMHGGSGGSGTDTRAQEAAAKHLDDLKNRAQEAESDLRAAQKARDAFTRDLKDTPLTPGQFDKQFAPLAQSVAKAEDVFTAAKKALATAENDPNTLREIKKGRLLPDYDADEAKRRNNEGYLDRRKDVSGYFAQSAIDRYGADSPLVYQRAQEAQQAAIAAERAKSGEGPEVWALKDLKVGPMRILLDSLGELDKSGRDREAQSQSDMLTRLMGNYDKRLRGIDLSARPNDLFGGDQDANELSRLKQKRNETQEEITDLGYRNLPGVSDALERLHTSLEDFDAGITNLTDKMSAQGLQKTIDSVNKDAEEKLRQLQLSQTPVAREQQAQQQQALDAARAAIEQTRFNSLFVINAMSGGIDMTANPLRASKERQEGIDAERRNAGIQAGLQAAEDAKQKYQGVYGQVQGQVVGAGMNFFKGKGGIGDLAKSLGDIIVNTAQEQFLKKFTDPLVQQITKEVLALEGLRVAVNTNTSALTGSSVDGATAPAGASAGSGAGSVGAGAGRGTGGASAADKAYGNFAKYAGAGLGAYSIFAQGQQQGVSLGGVLGGAAAGAQIGSVIPGIGTGIGAVVGGGLSLLGGLFGGHKEDPLDTSKQKDPALYNQPGDFEYQALRWHVIGKMPSQKDLGMNLPNIHAPVVNVYLDGVKQAVNKVLSNQTSPGSTNLSSHYYDMARP